MIKNAVAALAAAFLLSTAGCHRPPPTPPGFQGVVEYDERVVSFEAAGTVLGVSIHRGDTVKKGDVLATLDDRLETLARAARAGEVDVAQADLVLLEAGARKEDVGALAAQLKAAQSTEGLLAKTAERARALHEKGSLPLSDLERIEADHARAKAEVASVANKLAALQKGARPEEVARAKTRVGASLASVTLADEKIKRYVAKTLIGGTVLDVHVDPGELAGVGTPVATIADTSHPYVDVFVPQKDLGGIKVGNTATLRVDAATKGWTGKVEWISPRTEFTPRFLFSEKERANLVVRVRVRVDDPSLELHAGVPGFVEIAR